MAKKKTKENGTVRDDVMGELLSLVPVSLQKRFKEVSRKIQELPEETREKVMDLAFEINAIQTEMMDYAEESFLSQMPGIRKNAMGSEDDDHDYGVLDFPRYSPSANVKKYTLRVELHESPVPVWRRIVVPSNITLRHLSELLLDLMGWCGGHMNQFIKGRRYFQPGFQLEEDEFSDAELQEKHTIAELVQKAGQSCTLEYDFGNSWRHDVKLSGVAEYKEGEPRIIEFKAGEGCCPPEDCGGVWGYEDLLALHNKRLAGVRLSKE